MILDIRGLHVSIDGVPILQGLDLSLPYGQVHAIMGPNGTGKSTLAKVLAGHSAYRIDEGEIWFKGHLLGNMLPEERAHRGIFMSFQYPMEVAGVSNELFLRRAVNAMRQARALPQLSQSAFAELLDKKMERMQIRAEFRDRCVNVGFSGGEKKRNEILQMALLEPDLAILDETDSGLDIDAMRLVAAGVNDLRGPERSMILITHYQRLLDYIRPDCVHVMDRGKIVRSGGPELALILEEKGYEWI
jgi:Fe-S cluster assembly ATP-binding protein